MYNTIQTYRMEWNSYIINEVLKFTWSLSLNEASILSENDFLFCYEKLCPIDEKLKVNEKKR